MKEEYKKFKQTVEDFLNLLQKKEDRVIILDSEIENKRNTLAIIDSQLVDKQRLSEVQMEKLKLDLASERDRTFRFSREIEYKLAEAETLKAMAQREYAKAEQTSKQVFLKLKELEQKEIGLAEKLKEYDAKV